MQQLRFPAGTYGAERDGTKDIDHIREITLDIKRLCADGKYLAGNIKGKFEKGNIVWIQGESGSGKSTLVKLLLKFREIEGIYIDNTDISEITNRSLRAYVEYLSQNVPIIKGTLRENLFLNRKWDEETEEKYKSEPILKSILKTKTMDTLIEENGANLSGGEKKKIAIARVLYSNADVIILDEVTSNIDKDSAEEILSRIFEKRTRLFLSSPMTAYLRIMQIKG